MCGGVGVSGSPTPKLMTSTPAARFAVIFLSISAKRYGGRLSMRPASFTRSPFRRRGLGQKAGDTESERSFERLLRRTRHEDAALCRPFDVERASRQVDRDRPTGVPAKVRSHRDRARAGPACHRLSDAALPDTHPDLVVVQDLRKLS